MWRVGEPPSPCRLRVMSAWEPSDQDLKPHPNPRICEHGAGRRGIQAAGGMKVDNRLTLRREDAPGMCGQAQ